MSTIDEATLLAYLRCHYRVLEAPPCSMMTTELSVARRVRIFSAMMSASRGAG